MGCQHFTELWHMAFALICHFPKEEEREDPYFHVPRTWLLNTAILIFAPHNYFMGDVLHTIEYLASSLFSTWASLVAQVVNNLPTMLETWVWFLGQKEPLEKGMATHSSTLSWRIPWTEDPGDNHKEPDMTEQLTHCSLPARSPYHPLSLENQKNICRLFQIILS